MDFTFTEEQQQFQEAVQDFLANEVTPELLRSLWETETGRSDALWAQLAELGLTGMTVPESHGGLGMSEIDFILLAQECGYVALAEPLPTTVLVAVPLLNDLGDDGLRDAWLSKIAAGEARIAVGLECNELVEDAHIADAIVMQRGDALHFLMRDQVELRYNPSVDPSRRLYKVLWEPTAATCVADGTAGRRLWRDTLNRGALGVAAQALGLAQRMIDISVQYTTDRRQFGKPIGSFQAVKHHMANIAYRLEYAKAPLYRAAYAVTRGLNTADANVSHAKLAASEVANLAARNSVQVHGAMGYTWESDLHIFMKKAWALSNTWGDPAFHQQRVGDFVLADGVPLGAGNTFIG